MSTYSRLIRPLLFLLPPETAYHFAVQALRFYPLWRSLGKANGFKSPNLKREVAGITVENPIGLAAGFNKNCEAIPSLSSFGFGYLTCGTVTLHARPGNLGTRLLRDKRNTSLINSMGFPNNGLEVAVERIAGNQRYRKETPIVVSVSGTDIDEIVACHRRLEPLVDAVEVNISSPNTAGLRRFHDAEVLSELLTAVNEKREQPLFVKMPPFPSREENEEINKLMLSLAAVCASEKVGALTVANTQPVENAKLGVRSGGKSGKPIYDDMLRMVSEVRAVVGDAVAINACGGIFTAKDAWKALNAGADTVQLLTGMVFEGPLIAPAIAKGLDALASQERTYLNTRIAL